MIEQPNGNYKDSIPAELIARGAEVIAMEHDQMRKFAIIQKRSPAAAMETAIAELKAFPELAASGYYTIPRRSKECKHPASRTCDKCIKIEGASVGATRVVARNWGNCTAGVRVSDETDEHWDLEGRFLDFETNFSATRGLRLLKRVKWAGKIVYVSTMDPQMEMQIFQSGVSKCFRNVIRDGVPEAILERYWREAKAITIGKQPNRKLAKKAVKTILDAFEKVRVSAEMIEEHMGRTMDNWTNEDAARLRGLYSAIQGGEVQIGQVFAQDVQEPQPMPQPMSEESSPEPIEPEVVDDESPTPEDEDGPPQGRLL